jgi:NADH:ubiquinone oxidoreductase subunit E
MVDKVVIEICMGSSCFSRGNNKTLRVIQNYIKEHALESRTVLKGNHCFSDCSKGPVVRINETLYEEINEDNIIELLEKVLS